MRRDLRRYPAGGVILWCCAGKHWSKSVVAADAKHYKGIVIFSDNEEILTFSLSYLTHLLLVIEDSAASNNSVHLIWTFHVFDDVCSSVDVLYRTRTLTRIVEKVRPKTNVPTDPRNSADSPNRPTSYFNPYYNTQVGTTCG